MTKRTTLLGSLVFLLQHVAREGSDDEDVKVLGIYSTHEKAAAQIRKFKTLPGFKEYPAGFCISPYRLDHAMWAEGFFTYTYPVRAMKRPAKPAQKGK